MDRESEQEQQQYEYEILNPVCIECGYDIDEVSDLRSYEGKFYHALCFMLGDSDGARRRRMIVHHPWLAQFEKQYHQWEMFWKGEK